MRFRKNLRRLREAKVWNQNKLAKRAGIEQFHLSQIEDENIAHPHLNTIKALIGALGVYYERLVKRLLQDVGPENYLEHCDVGPTVSVNGA